MILKFFNLLDAKLLRAWFMTPEVTDYPGHLCSTILRSPPLAIVPTLSNTEFDSREPRAALSALSATLPASRQAAHYGVQAQRGITVRAGNVTALCTKPARLAAFFMFEQGAGAG